MHVNYVLFAFMALFGWYISSTDFLPELVLLKVMFFCRRNRMQYDRDGLMLSMKMNMLPDWRVWQLALLKDVTILLCVLWMILAWSFVNIKVWLNAAALFNVSPDLRLATVYDHWCSN